MEELLKQILEGQKQLFEGQKQLFSEVSGIKGEVFSIKSEVQDLSVRMKSLESQARENTDVIKAIQHNTEIIGAKVDALTVTTASKESMTALSKNVDDIGSDLSFLVRKAAKHDDDIRQLRQAQ